MKTFIRSIKKERPLTLSLGDVFKSVHDVDVARSKCHDKRPSQKVTLILCSFSIFIFEQHLNG